MSAASARTRPSSRSSSTSCSTSRALANDRRAHPTADLASVIANAEIDGKPIADLDAFGHYLIIATAGHDTTSSAMGGGMLALLDYPDQLELLQAQPELVHNAADEFIRYVSPVKHFLRTCQAPFTLRDVTFEPGDLVLLSFASANRDEEVFADPFRLDVQRENAASHLAFGFGRHFCLGAHLARMEIRALFGELLGPPRVGRAGGDAHLDPRLLRAGTQEHSRSRTRSGRGPPRRGGSPCQQHETPAPGPPQEACTASATRSTRPFCGKDGEDIDWEAYRTLVRYCVGPLRHDMLWLTSGVGEWWSLTGTERRQLLEIAVDEARAVAPDTVIQACTSASFGRRNAWS